MRLIMNAINGHYLQNIILNSSHKTEAVLAAVAYATADLLFDWCRENSIPLTYYGRLDENIAVNISILDGFLQKQSPNYVCKLVQHHHAKVIWWRGVGMYIGSANLTNNAWSKNVEAGCYFEEEEISDVMANDISDLFDTLKTNSAPLTKELVKEMEKRSKTIGRSVPDATEFWNSPSFKKWPGLIQTTPKEASERKRNKFLEEWHATLQDLRDIGQKVNQPENRPSWINPDVPVGAQTDQFLHAHYYQRTFEGRKANYEHFFEENQDRKAEALEEAMEWWRNLTEAPGEEDEMLNKTAPFLQSALSQESLPDMDEGTFHNICLRVHSIREHARRVPNKSVNLPSDGTRYDEPQKVEALAKRIWREQSSGGDRVKQLLAYILYDGPSEQLPERLWQGITDSELKIDGLGISSLGEVVGWALPSEFPPRNGRTSKALRSLGYDVTVHVE